ncbi:MAG TPA: CBS domain-containing protein [Saprospiraceae bacterium]|nr:CBS domain-containing protein [Saprospiraceae bacterium]HMQ84112.1 CBS domain-containing protein [Saprospiraceae bacterium]
MNAELLLSDSIIPLRTSDTGEEALAMMSDFYVRHLPIVNNTQLLGLIAEDDILDNDPEEAVGAYSLSLVNTYVHAKDHIYETLRLLAEYQLTVVPVVDDEGNYIGLITLEDIVHFFAKTASFSESGSILVLEVNKRDYALSEIARIVESENATIISSFITSTPEYAILDVTIKINRQNISNIIASFLRYDYTIKASFNEQEYIDSLKDRYDSLMAYLNV